MMEGETYVKIYAVSLLATGVSPMEALRLAKEAWARREENERIIETLMKETK